MVRTGDQRSKVLTELFRVGASTSGVPLAPNGTLRTGVEHIVLSPNLGAVALLALAGPVVSRGDVRVAPTQHLRWLLVIRADLAIIHKEHRGGLVAHQLAAVAQVVHDVAIMRAMMAAIEHFPLYLLHADCSMHSGF